MADRVLDIFFLDNQSLFRQLFNNQISSFNNLQTAVLTGDITDQLALMGNHANFRQVVSFGGFLGIGEDYYPMPWPHLKYDTRLGGYKVGITEDQLKGAPKYGRYENWDWSNRANDERVYGYYNTPLWYD